MSSPISLLVVDDEHLIRWSVTEHLTRCGHAVAAAESGEQALELLADKPPDVMLLDVRLPGIDGLATLRHALSQRPDLAVVMISAHASVDDAVEAMKQGAIDFLVKPFSFQALDAAVQRALSAVRVRQQVSKNGHGPGNGAGVDTIIGESAAIENIRRTVSRCASAGPTTVLIAGESGAGKEVIARAIHAESDRASKPFLHLNCAALPEQLVESELFGHERGAFTSAHSRKIGIIEAAEGGTVFLDEIGELYPSAQAKLLQLLENKTFRRVGGVAELHADVRLLAASNVDLAEQASEGNFRADLYYRLNVIRIEMPPLRDRSDDIALFAAHFIARFNTEMNRQVRGLTPQALEALRAYRWPGNVRELRNVIERALILHPDATELGREDLPDEVRKSAAPATPVLKPAARKDEAPIELDVAEHRLIVEALNRTTGNQSKAARLLGISRDTLRYRMKKHGLM